jgi:hypothetical protein
MGLTIPESFDLFDPPAVNVLLAAPALLEICALTLLVHALVRPAGAAYALSALVAFIAVVNHEIEIVSYPPAQIGIPVHTTLSELTGWSPWIEPVLAADAFKAGVAAFAAAVAWLAWPRGTDLSRRDRVAAAIARARGGAGVFMAASVVVLCLFGWLLHDRLVVRGDFVSPAQADADDAAWETRFWNEACGFSVEGGEVVAEVSPSKREARVRWTLQNVRAKGPRLHGGLASNVTMEHDHFMVDLGACAKTGCTVALTLTVTYNGWPSEKEPPWLDASGVWARASDLLPRLGHDPERKLRSPVVRRSFGLPETRIDLDPHALTPGLAVAPTGRWN